MLNNKTVEIINENENIRSRKNNYNQDSFLTMNRLQKRSEMNLNNHGPLSSSSSSSINQGELFQQQNFPTIERNPIQQTKTGLNFLNQLNYDRKTTLSDSFPPQSQNGSTPAAGISSMSENERSGGNGNGNRSNGGEGEKNSITEGNRIMQVEKDTLELRKELQEAIACKKQAENRVIAWV